MIYCYTGVAFIYIVFELIRFPALSKSIKSWQQKMQTLRNARQISQFEVALHSEFSYTYYDQINTTGAYFLKLWVGGGGGGV